MSRNAENTTERNPSQHEKKEEWENENGKR